MYVSKKDAATADLVRKADAVSKKAMKDTRGYGKPMKAPPNPLQGFAFGGLVMGPLKSRNDYSKKGKHSTGCDYG